MKWTLKYLILPLLTVLTSHSDSKLSACGDDTNGSYRAEIDVSGRELIAWTDSQQVAYFSIRSADQTVDTVTALSLPGQVCFEAIFEVNTNGDIVVLWLATTPEKASYTLYAKTYPINGEWSPLYTLSNSVEGVSAHTLALFLSDSGDITAFWESITYYYADASTITGYSNDLNTIRGTLTGGFEQEENITTY